MTTSLSRCSLTVLALTLLAGPAHAGGTQTHEVDDFSDFDKGEVEGAAIEKSGRVTRGYASTSAELKVSTVFSCLGDGKRAWIGTADEATIQRVDLRGQEPVVEPLVELEGVVVSALARLPGGDLVAAVLPGGKLLRIDAKGQSSDFAELKDVEQIWAIVPHKGRLLVATGPRGELWSVGTDGKDAKVVLDTPEKNVLSVATVGDAVLVGTSPKARLYRLGDEPEGELLHEFKGNEVRALAQSGSQLVAAVNRFEDRSVSSRTALSKQLNRASLTGERPLDNDTRRARASADASLWAVDLGQKRDLARAQDAAWDEWLSKSDQYFIDLVASDDAGTVVVASSEGGKIYRARGRRDVAVIADLEQAQATSLCTIDKGDLLATAGDGAAVYRLSQAPAAKARWVSEVLDAKQPARYGSFVVRGTGKLQLRARTGPSEEVDDRWSDWQTVVLRPENAERRGSTRLDQRRYLQLEIELGDDAELREVVAFYAPENLAPLLEKVVVTGPKVDASSDDEADATMKIEWTAEARDSDELSYEVRIRPVGGRDDDWLRLDRDGPLSKTSLELDLDTLADGVYEVQVTASDEPSNGSGTAARDQLVSEPFVIDRTRPSLADVKVDGTRVTGVARDEGSYVRDVAYSVDGGSFRAASASDGLFDSGSEGFELRLSDDLGPGPVRVVIRARDARGNIETLALRVDG